MLAKWKPGQNILRNLRNYMVILLSDELTHSPICNRYSKLCCSVILLLSKQWRLSCRKGHADGPNFIAWYH